MLVEEYNVEKENKVIERPFLFFVWLEDFSPPGSRSFCGGSVMFLSLKFLCCHDAAEILARGVRGRGG